MLRISTLSDRKRMSTRELLLTISRAVAEGEHHFHISASGQHDIGGPLWSPDGETLLFEVSNPGQRVGGMCLPGTRVVVEGSVPADAGWLNSGGEVVIKGDSGDTTGHCAAGGKIYVGGSSGARTGALMKHDPQCEPPQLWILENTGSFSFEFMGGGIAVVCGHNCLTMPSVLGDRPCVGMVDGIIYFRGQLPAVPKEVRIAELDENDRAFLENGLKDFLQAIGKPQLKRDLSIWKHWHKIVPNSAPTTRTSSIKEFKKAYWFENGLFADLVDDKGFTGLVPHGKYRLKQPFWDNNRNQCTDCMICLKNCPEHAIKRRMQDTAIIYAPNSERCIGCGICACVCPHEIWKMESNA